MHFEVLILPPIAVPASPATLPLLKTSSTPDHLMAISSTSKMSIAALVRISSNVESRIPGTKIIPKKLFDSLLKHFDL